MRAQVQSASLTTPLTDGTTEEVSMTPDRALRVAVVAGGGGGGGSTAISGPLGPHAASQSVAVVGASPIAPASFLASGPLPAAGAWTAATPYAIPAGLKRVGFYVTYTGGSAGGQVRYRVRKGVSTSLLASEQVVDSTLVPSPPEGSQAVYDQVFNRPVTGTTATSFPVDVDVEGGWTHVVLDLAELGDTANPGTAAITIVGSY